MIHKRCRIAGTVAVLLSAVGSATSPVSAARPGDEHWDNQFGPVGANDILQAIAVDGSKVYVGGYLTAAGNTRASLVAGFDHPNWFALNKGIPMGNQSFFYVSTLAVAGRSLYAGGWFTGADNVYSPFLARWDGNNWSALRGAALNAPVLVVKTVGTNLYVAGVFNRAGNVGVSHVAGWDGTNWFALGGRTSKGLTHFDRSALSFLPAGTNLYAGGIFTEAGDVLANGIAQWNGIDWSALGGGLTGTFIPGTVPAARALVLIGPDLYVGGRFIYAGDKPSMFIARWNEERNFYPPAQPRLVNPTWLGDGSFRFRLVGTSGERYTIETSTSLGPWTPLLTNSATLYDFTDATAPGYPTRNYRAVVNP